MHKLGLALALPPLLALGACGGDGQAAEPDAAAVPAGVEEQYTTLEEELAEKGDVVTSGEWEVGTIVEAAEPWYAAHGSHQEFRPPAKGETHHIEIIPREAATGRIVPDVPITLEVIDHDGKVVEKEKLDFYYSTFFHYATNFSIPEDGTYTLKATLGAPDFLRHGEEGEEPPLAEGTTVAFDGVELTRE